MSELATRTPQQELVEWVTSPERIQQFAMALPEGIRRERFERALKTALVARPELVKADRASLYLALLRGAELGLVPDGRQATINVYREQAVWITMIGGVRDMLAEFGWMLQTAVVYEKDEFAFDEAAQHVTHRPTRLGAARGEIVGAYAQATHKDGRRMAEAMSIADILLVRDKANAPKNGPWYDQQSYPRMVEKTPGHRLAKKLPLDPKDRERVNKLLIAEDLTSGGAADLLYGPEDSGAAAALPTQAAATSGAPEHTSDAGLALARSEQGGAAQEPQPAAPPPP